MYRALIFVLVLCNFVLAQQAKRVITNLDLEKYRQQRIEAEQEYLQTYQQKGLPSPEEIEKISEERRRRLAEYSEKYQQQMTQIAEDFRRRSNEIRLQIASVEAQIAYVRKQIANIEGPYRGGTLSSGVFTGTFFFPNFSQNTNTNVTIPPNVQAVQNIGLGFPTATEIRNRVNGISLPIPQSSVPSTQLGGFFFFPIVVDNTNYNLQRSLERLQELEQLRAGLLATLSELEEQARRLGIQIR
jgi:hypothetical protein